jgi:uncharacterized repeat protein (TIGR01451 family)
MNMKKQTRKSMRVMMVAVVLSLVFFFSAIDAHALGTPAGTTINNKATVNYTMGAINYSLISNTNTLRVDEVLNNTVTWQDALPGVTVSPGQTNQVLTMKLTNTGNGVDTYTLSAISTQVTGTDFLPVSVTIYLDTNGDKTYTPGTDQLYVPGTNDPTLLADQSLTLFVLSNIPSTGLVDGQKGNVQLTATSQTGTGAPGAVLSGKGPGGTDAVVGLSGGSSSRTGTYVDSSITVNVNKTVVVMDQLGGSQPMTGATVRYTLTVTATGSGTAMNVVITDPIPTNTTYKPGTLKLNSALLTDAADVDAGDVGGTTAGTVTVMLGNLTSASPTYIITFDVKIN